MQIFGTGISTKSRDHFRKDIDLLFQLGSKIRKSTEENEVFNEYQLTIKVANPLAKRAKISEKITMRKTRSEYLLKIESFSSFLF